ncbi:MAG TPA: hypothetical protein VF173_06735 [Thermoanaerobaculia bacterium]|nr:hypothetical protein [Thermoanaerobaculia bacterium]
MFEKEIAVYSKIKSKLPLGQFVLIHGDELIGVFATDAEAVTAGARRFGLEPYLVRQVRSEESAISNPALSLGILRASSTY